MPILRFRYNYDTILSLQRCSSSSASNAGSKLNRFETKWSKHDNITLPSVFNFVKQGITEKNSFLRPLVIDLFCSHYPPIKYFCWAFVLFRTTTGISGEQVFIVIGFQLGTGSEMSHFEPEWSEDNKFITCCMPYSLSKGCQHGPSEQLCYQMAQNFHNSAMLPFSCLCFSRFG